MALIGELSVGISANIKPLTRGLAAARKKIKKFRRSLNATASSLKLFTAGIAAAAGAGGMGLLIKRSFATIDSLGKVSAKLGIMTEDLAGLRLAASEAGISSRTLDMALQRMVRRVSEAAVGTGEAQKAIRELGLSAQRLASLSPDEQVKALADAFGGLSSEGDKVRLAMKFFDSEGVSMVNVLSKGREGLEEAAQAAKDLGLAVSGFDVANIEAANDAMGRMRSVVDGISNTFAIMLAPFVENLSKQFTSAAAGADTFRAVGERIARAFAKVGDVVAVLKIGFIKVREVFLKVIAAISSGMQWLTDQVVNLLNKIPGVEAVAARDGENFAAALRKRAAEDAATVQRLLAQQSPSERLAKHFAKQARERERVNREAASKAASMKQLAFMERIGKAIGAATGTASSRAGQVAAAAISRASSVFGAAQSPAATNRAIEASTAEGYRALRSNVGRNPEKEQNENLRKILEENRKAGDVLVDIAGSLREKIGTVLTIPSA